MSFDYVFGGLAVREIDPAREWYERLFGREPDLVPNDREACWDLTGTGWVYIVVDEDRAGGGVLTVLVDDLDELLAELDARGIEMTDTEEVAGLVRTAHILDPDGNRIQFGQDLSGAG